MGQANKFYNFPNWHSIVNFIYLTDICKNIYKTIEYFLIRGMYEPTYVKQHDDISCSLMKGAYYINDFCIRNVYRGVGVFQRSPLSSHVTVYAIRLNLVLHLFVPIPFDQMWRRRFTSSNFIAFDIVSSGFFFFFGSNAAIKTNDCFSFWGRFFILCQFFCWIVKWLEWWRLGPNRHQELKPLAKKKNDIWRWNN